MLSLSTAQLEKMKQNVDSKNIIAIIPARSGSKGLPGKHMKPINEQPVISYTIDAARGVSMLERVLVSTDDAGVITYCDQNEVEVISRPERLATDTADVVDALVHSVEVLEKESNVDIVV